MLEYGELVLVADSAGADNERRIAVGEHGLARLLGAHADEDALQTAAALLGRPVARPARGEVLVIRGGQATTLRGPAGTGYAVRG